MELKHGLYETKGRKHNGITSMCKSWSFVVLTGLAAGFSAPYLSVYSENAVDVFDVNTMEWIQTMPLKKVRQAVP